MSGYSVIAKPVGSRCNLECTYCYYLEKKAFIGRGSPQPVMTDDILEAFVEQMFLQPHPSVVEFAWQGGEPLLAGLPFFQRVIELQKRHSKGRPFANTIQTNGTLLTDQWCEWLSLNRVLVGLSLDGPPHLHDRFRLDHNGNGTGDKVTAAIQRMKKHGVDFNILATLNRVTADHPLEVYSFLKEVGQGFVQFVPIVEREPGNDAQAMGLNLELPDQIHQDTTLESPTTTWSVQPEQLGYFYTRVYDEWIKNDVGTVFVQLFDATLAGFLNAPSPVCFYSGCCGQSGVLEHNGDVYACDHFVYPQFRRGNILSKSMSEMLEGQAQKQFGLEKRESLPQYCILCPYLSACNGECPKNRFGTSPDGERGVNYLCSGYRQFFQHAAPSMKKMADIILSGGIASEIM